MKQIGTGMLLMMLFMATVLYAQKEENPRIVPLKVGDKCPDFEFSGIVNGKVKSLRLSDLKGKLVIIDFWATWCGPCIQELPKMDSLQKQFGDKIAILPVTYQSKEKVKQERENSIILGSISLPLVTGNTELRKYFPHRQIPHEVWIDQNGYVKSITTPDHVTARNITYLLRNGSLSVSQKKDITDVDYRKPLLLGGLGQTYTLDPQNILYSSIILKYIEGLPGQEGGPEIRENHARILSTNSSIEGLYRTAFATSASPLKGPKNPDFSFRMPSRMIWEANNIKPGSHTDFVRNPLQVNETFFSYEIMAPKEDSNFINQYAVEDLNRFFGTKFGIEGIKQKRKVKCWVLTRTTTKDLLKSKGGKPVYDLLQERNIIRVRNTTLNEFLFYWLNYCLYTYPIPVIDETGYKEPVDLDINTNLKNVNAVSNALKPYGLEFRQEERELDMIVIRDKQ